MERIKPGKYVEIIYDLYEVSPSENEQTVVDESKEGTVGKGERLVHQVDPADPEKFVFGVTRGMIEPLERVLDGKTVGDAFDVYVKSDEAFGPYDPEQVATLEKEIFLVDDKFDDNVIKAGALVPMMTADGYRINGLVKEVTADNVVMDFNHPLAGKDVRFKGTVKTVRDATAEELQPAHSCGCGCGCGDEACGEGCGDHCGCDDNHHCGDDACGCGCK